MGGRLLPAVCLKGENDEKKEKKKTRMGEKNHTGTPDVWVAEESKKGSDAYISGMGVY